MIFEEIYKSTGLVPINEINVLKMNRMCISVDPSPNENYGNIAYFKVYNNSSPKAATEVIRLHFYDAGYDTVICPEGQLQVLDISYNISVLMDLQKILASMYFTKHQ